MDFYIYSDINSFLFRIVFKILDLCEAVLLNTYL